MLFALVFCIIAPAGSADPPISGEAILKKMETAYAQVNDYKTKVEVKIYGKDGKFETQRFTYSFKKPKWIRLDFESPHPGMTVVYPDSNGKVAVQPAGLAHLLKLHLAPDNRLLVESSSGQRIDQTDIGLLIANISHSLTDQRRGPEQVIEDGNRATLRVLAVDHFKPGVTTLYQFCIDKNLWLPVGVEEFTPAGTPEKSITFDSLKTNNGFADSLFKLDAAASQQEER